MDKVPVDILSSVLLLVGSFRKVESERLQCTMWWEKKKSFSLLLKSGQVDFYIDKALLKCDNLLPNSCVVSGSGCFPETLGKQKPMSLSQFPKMWLFGLYNNLPTSFIFWNVIWLGQFMSKLSYTDIGFLDCCKFFSCQKTNVIF